MKLKVINSGSKGNAYLLENDTEALLIECGVSYKEIKAALNFNLKKLKGCILTHEHMDHAKSANDLLGFGVSIYATKDTHTALDTIKHHRAYYFNLHEAFYIGGFKVQAFDVLHDAAEPCGFLINHKEIGNTLFMTDLIFSAYTFKNLNNIIIEANYHEDLAKRKLQNKEFLRNRIIKNHMSLDTCVKTLKANDLSKVNNIVLIHLSDSNSDEKLFKDTVHNATGKTVTIADKGVTIDFNKTPF